MGKRSFTWNPDGICIFGSWSNPKSKCFFDYWSIYHFYFPGFAYIILHHYLGIDNVTDATKLLIFITIVHIIEEFLGNTSKLSGEGIVYDYIAPIFNPKINPALRTLDNDYVENSIGDVVAGIISCGLIILYWMYFGKLPCAYLYFMPVILWMLWHKSNDIYT